MHVLSISYKHTCLIEADVLSDFFVFRRCV